MRQRILHAPYSRPESNMHRDLERRHAAIVRALRGTGADRQRSKASRPDVTALSGVVDELANRVNAMADALQQLQRDGVGKAAAPAFDPDDDPSEAPVTRVSVPPLLPTTQRHHAFDALLGHACAERGDEDATGEPGPLEGDRAVDRR
jgi:hypothetical protein